MGTGFGRPIGGDVYAEGEDGDFYYKDYWKKKRSNRKNNQGVTPTKKFPNFESDREEHGSPGALGNCSIKSTTYNEPKKMGKSVLEA